MSSNVIVNLPEVTAILEFTAETYTLTVAAYSVSTSGACNGASLADAAAGSVCVLGLTTEFAPPGITTTFIPEQTITIVDVDQRVSCHC